MPNTQDVYVIWFREKDGSGAGVLRVHSDPDRAEEEKDLLETQNNDREYAISEQPVYDGLARGTE